MDRASDYGSEGWGFESLRARSGPVRCDPPAGVLRYIKPFREAHDTASNGDVVNCPRGCGQGAQAVECEVFAEPPHGFGR